MYVILYLTFSISLILTLNAKAYVILPNLLQLRNVAERMKNISDRIEISCNNAGTLRFRVESDLANVETEWRNLQNPDLGTFWKRSH